MNNPVRHTNTPGVFHSRRLSDPVSPLNETIHDSARVLLQAVERVDALGLHIMSITAECYYNKRIHVAYSPECAALDGVETSRSAGWSHWNANRFGVEILWCIPTQEAA